MQINSFKLVNEGFGGIEVEANEYLNSGNNLSIVDGVKRKRKIPVSKELIGKIQELRYAFLNLTGHWLPEYSMYMNTGNTDIKQVSFDAKEFSDQRYKNLLGLWNRTFVHEVKISGNGEGFKIKGRVDISIDKFVTITSPVVYMDDDFSFFNMTIDLLNDICSDIVRFINSASTPLSAREFMHQLYSGDQGKIEESEGKSEDELIAEMIETLEKRGALVLMDDDGKLGAIGNGSDQVSVHQSKNEIDRDNIDVYDENDDQEYERYLNDRSGVKMEREEERVASFNEKEENQDGNGSGQSEWDVDHWASSQEDDDGFFKREPVLINEDIEEEEIVDSLDLGQDEGFDQDAAHLNDAEYSDKLPGLGD